MSLLLFNTLTRQKEQFVPARGKQIGMYVCGVTVYDYCHVGHARAAIVFDTLYRYLQYLGYEVRFVRNFTDIDDKIINRANEEGIDWQEVNRKYIEAFYQDMEKLNIGSPTIEPKATDHIPEMLDMIQSLVDQEKAYESDGNVFYSIKSFKEYGCLSGKKIEDLKSGARVEVNETKRDPLDFALWKKSKPGEPFWSSPWGPGRPGWHIECSAMSKKYLGDTFDIHGGGKDLVFPHHENEIAQSCAASDEPFVNYWLHNEHLLVDGQKMSKSLGNFYTLRDLLEKGFSPEALRYTLISTHYRSKLNFTFEKVKDSQKCINKLLELKRRLKKVDSEGESKKDFSPTAVMLEKFSVKLGDDLNISGALGELFTWVNGIFTELDDDRLVYCEAGEALDALKKIDSVLGVLDYESVDINEEIKNLIKTRNDARSNKNWAAADKARDTLDAMGILLEDTPDGTIWKKK